MKLSLRAAPGKGVRKSYGEYRFFGPVVTAEDLGSR